MVEGDRVNLAGGQKDKDTKIFDFNDSVSSLKPLDFVRIFLTRICEKCIFHFVLLKFDDPIINSDDEHLLFIC